MARPKSKKNPGFAERFAAELHRRGLTNREFARQISIHENSVGKYKRGSVPDQPILFEISKALDRSINWLLAGQEELEKKKLGTGEVSIKVGSKPADIEERRTFNQISGLNEEEALALARWFEQYPEIKKLVVEWAHARTSGLLSGVDEADRLEFDAKAKASYLLANLEREKEEKIPGG